MRTLLFALAALLPFATQATEPDARVYELKNHNTELSPFTGMDRQHWIDCGKFMLEGAFQHVDSIEQPMLFPKVPGKSYPQLGYDKCPPEQRSAAIFEGVARTFNIAAPLIALEPDLTIHGIRLADYYKYQLLQLTDPKCDYFIGYGDKNDGPEQQTCELGNLALWMMLLPDVVWTKLAPAEQDQIANVMGGWAKGWTKTHNWRWFNVMMMTFLKTHGYAIDEKLMLAHLDHLLMLESGEGWFRDQSHDYYTSHVFQLYGSVWNRVYGWEHEPGRAAVIDAEFHRFMDNYPMFFGRGGEVNMWGRSILYRMGASAAMSAAFVRGREPGIDPGYARRIGSGALLQFVTHPGFFQNGVPSLGFYGHFEPAIQAYSCAASPFWMFMNYTALTLPADDPFWTAKENEGGWPALGAATKTKFLPGAGLLVVNHGSTGTSEIVNGKVHNDDPSYCRLRYNTGFPWEADDLKVATAGQLQMQNAAGSNKAEFPESINLAGFKNNVLYRQAIFKKDSLGGTPTFCDMADIAIPGGHVSIVRFRKVRPSKLLLGHYGLPHISEAAEIAGRTVDGRKSITSSIAGRQLAVTNYQGWSKVATVAHHGLNPETDDSTVTYLDCTDPARYGAPAMLISIMLHKTDDKPWTDDELQPIRSCEPLKPGIEETLGGVRITLKTGETHDVDFTGIDGSSSR